MKKLFYLTVSALALLSFASCEKGSGQGGGKEYEAEVRFYTQDPTLLTESFTLSFYAALNGGAYAQVTPQATERDGGKDQSVIDAFIQGTASAQGASNVKVFTTKVKVKAGQVQKFKMFVKKNDSGIVSKTVYGLAAVKVFIPDYNNKTFAGPVKCGSFPRAADQATVNSVLDGNELIIDSL